VANFFMDFPAAEESTATPRHRVEAFEGRT
jgi:hypothetical protein